MKKKFTLTKEEMDACLKYAIRGGNLGLVEALLNKPGYHPNESHLKVVADYYGIRVIEKKTHMTDMLAHAIYAAPKGPETIDASIEQLNTSIESPKGIGMKEVWKDQISILKRVVQTRGIVKPAQAIVPIVPFVS